jgi:hypothetical protein
MGTVLYMLNDGIKTILHIYREPEVGEAVLSEINYELSKLSADYEQLQVEADRCRAWEVGAFVWDEHVEIKSKLSTFLPPKTFLDFDSFFVGLAHVPMD